MIYYIKRKNPENSSEYKKAYGFYKKDRSSFKYWFAHLCAFNMTALNLGVWKPKYLFHDFEKPWLKMIFSYKRVQEFHRKHSKHHLEYGRLKGWNKVDWTSLIIDYECSRFTKLQAPLDARETLDLQYTQDKWKPYAEEIKKNVEPLMEKLGL